MTQYAVIFDNDPRSPGLTHFCVIDDDMGFDIKFLVSDISICEHALKVMKRRHPVINYRIVEVTLKELET